VYIDYVSAQPPRNITTEVKVELYVIPKAAAKAS